MLKVNLVPQDRHLNLLLLILRSYRLTWFGKRPEKRRQMITSILGKTDDKGYVKASYMQLGADTGRMSSIKPIINRYLEILSLDNV